MNCSSLNRMLCLTAIAMEKGAKGSSREELKKHTDELARRYTETHDGQVTHSGV